MHVRGEDDFVGDDWETLPELVKEVAEPWRLMLQEAGEVLEPIEGNLAYFVQHLLWLVPLAETLKQRPELRALFPLVHHAVIELRQRPHSIAHDECFTFFAEADGLYRLSFDRWTPRPFRRYAQELGRGNVWHVADILVNSLSDIDNSILTDERS